MQENVEIHILIRDDGSDDRTRQIILEIVDKYPNKFEYIFDQNVGAKNSFFDLINRAYEKMNEYDYFAFCDQDDVWLKDKLFRAVKKLQTENSSTPLLYCSSTQMVNTVLEPLSIWPLQPKKELSVYNATVENVVVGCTTILNQTALKLIATHLPDRLDYVIMHDWWAYLSVSSFGKVIFDPEPSILYRQHGNNALGGQTDSFINKWRKRFKRYAAGQNHYILSQQAKEFLCSYRDLLDEGSVDAISKLTISHSKNVLVRLIYAIRLPFYRQSRMDQLILKCIISLGKV
jgi:glycosyltransferase involved in cell wall biosynthesis